MLQNYKKFKEPYKEPVFLFTSCSLRFAAWAGWYSALGDKEMAESWTRQAMSEWAKEIGAGRQFWFFKRGNNDIEDYIPKERLKEVIEDFFKTLKKEVKRGKAASKASS